MAFSKEFMNDLEDAALVCLLEEVEEDEEQERQGTQRRMWVHPAWQKRDEEGEFFTLYKELEEDPNIFHQYFRMSQECFNLLLAKLGNSLTKQNTNYRESISAKQRLAVCLRYLATGDSQRTISFSYRLGHSTVGSIIHEACRSIVANLQQEMLPPPTEERWRQIAQKFEEICKFPNCIGAVDGKHVVIQAPKNSGSQFFNYKKTFSTVLMALVDAECNFVAVDVGGYGRHSDGGIFAHSNLGKALDTGRFNVPGPSALPGTNAEAPFVVVGDQAFPLKKWLMRPYPGESLPREKEVFNVRLTKARRVVENAFGILAQKFRIYNRRIHADPDNVDNIVMATCILHNFIKMHDRKSFRVPLDTGSGGSADSSGGIENLPLQGGNASHQAFQTRELFKDYFNSAIGMIPMQQRANPLIPRVPRQ